MPKHCKTECQWTHSSPLNWINWPFGFLPFNTILLNTLFTKIGITQLSFLFFRSLEGWRFHFCLLYQGERGGYLGGEVGAICWEKVRSFQASRSPLPSSVILQVTAGLCPDYSWLVSYFEESVSYVAYSQSWEYHFLHFLAFSRDSTGLVSLHLHWSSWQHQGQVEENKLFAFTANWGPFAVECAGLKFNHNMRLHHHRTMHKVFCGKFKSVLDRIRFTIISNIFRNDLRNMKFEYSPFGQSLLSWLRTQDRHHVVCILVYVVVSLYVSVAKVLSQFEEKSNEKQSQK